MMTWDIWIYYIKKNKEGITCEHLICFLDLGNVQISLDLGVALPFSFFV